MRASFYDHDLTLEINQHRARQARRAGAVRGLKVLAYSAYCVAIGWMLGAILASL